MRYIIKYFPEISLKSKPVRKQFVKQLRSNLNSVCKEISSDIKIQSEWDHLMIDTPEFDNATYRHFIDTLKNTSGICLFLEVQGYSFETLDDIVEKALELYQSRLEDKTFVVRCKRSGEHEFNSHQAEQYIGGGLLQKSQAAGVKLKGADETISIEIKKQKVYLVRERFEGLGGYPLGSLGSVLSLISGGYDSPVASYLMMRRGIATHFCFFNLGGHAHEVGVKEVAHHLWTRYGVNRRVQFITVPFEGVITELMENVDNSYMGVVLKRMMIRAAERVASNYNFKALVTGEAIAQVSSQTLSNLAAIDNVSKMLIMRPVVSMDKSDIIKKAKQIGTAVFAENMPEYCGVISVKPTTKAKLERIEHEESKFDFSVLDSALENIKAEKIDNMSFEGATKVEEFAFPVGGAVIVDVRHPDEAERKPLKTQQKNKTINIPFYKINEKFSGLDKRQTYCLYCDKGVMSRMHASLLYEQGFTNVAVYRPNV